MSIRLRLWTGLLLSLVLVGTGLAVEGDIVFKKDGATSAMAPAVFPHWLHRIRYKCYACHPSLFEMKKGASDVSMTTMQNGGSCGACHNGEIAWAVSAQSCNWCHTGE
jgi:c(7)-type cytochrome triheme protein